MNMIQGQSIILWRNADKEDRSFEEIALEIFEVLDLLQSYPEILRPNYLAVSSLKDAVKFRWDLQNFMDALKRGVNKEKDRTFEDLGYSLSFFSSFNENASCSIMVKAGMKNKLFYNTLIINLPLSFDLYDRWGAESAIELFKGLAYKYRPLWGCISNDAMPVPQGKFLKGNIPTGIHWINYWSKEVVDAIGMDRINKTVSLDPTVTFKDVFFLIKETAIDINRKEDMQLCDNLNQLLFQ